MHSRLARMMCVVLMSAAISTSAKGTSVTGPQAVPPIAEDDWVALGARIHGAFGSYVALGVQIGLDSLARLHAGRAGVDVTVIDGPEAPCACIADGLMLATGATPGRGTLRVSAGLAPKDVFAIIEIKTLPDGEILRVLVPADARTLLDRVNTLPAEQRLAAIRAAQPGQLFHFESR